MALREEPTRWDEELPLTGEQSRGWLGRSSTPFDDQEIFDRFVNEQIKKIEKRLEHCLSREVQLEVGHLLELLTNMPRGLAYENRSFFELAFNGLAGEQPNLVLVAQLRGILLTATARSTWLGSMIIGRVPIQTVVLGLLSTLLLLFAAIVLLDLGHAYLRQAAGSPALLHPIAEILQGMPMAQIIALVLAAFVGALVSVLSRLRSMLDVARATPLLVYITVATKPLVSIAFATFIYAVIGSGLIAIPGIGLDTPNVGYMVWAIGFLSGFSERFVHDFVGQADKIVDRNLVGDDPPRSSPNN